MKYRVDGWNNFCRVFEIPLYPSRFCFDGIPVMFTMVDWFNPCSLPNPAISKDTWIKKFGEFEEITVDQNLAVELAEFMKGKNYVKLDKRYLTVCSFGLSFLFNKNGLITE